MKYPFRRFVVALAGIVVLCASPLVRAEDWASLDGASEFSLGIGYANVSLSGSSVIDGESALRFEPTLSFSPIRQLPQLRLGTSVGVTMVLDNSSRTIVSGDGGLIFVGSSEIPLWLLEPELRLSWRQYFGDNHEIFIEPGVAGGVAFGFLELDSDDSSADSYDADDSSVYGKVFLRVGARVTGGLAGVEASWATGDRLDFGGNAAGDLGEFYVGVFGALCF